jgi:hypothetical protein
MQQEVHRMSHTPPSALPRTQYEITGYLPGGGILSHLGQRPWLDNAGNSPIVARLQGGGMAKFTLDPTDENSQEYYITVSVTPDPDPDHGHSNWVVNVAIPCFSRPGILDQILDGWETGRGGTMKARGVRFPGLDRMDDHLEQKPAGGVWGKCLVIIVDVGQNANDWGKESDPTPPLIGDPTTLEPHGGIDPR